MEEIRVGERGRSAPFELGAFLDLHVRQGQENLRKRSDVFERATESNQKRTAQNGLKDLRKRSEQFERD